MLELTTIQGLFKASPVASIIIYPDAPTYTIAWVNPACLQLTGANLTDMVGLSIFEVLAEPADEKIDYTIKGNLLESLSRSLGLKCAVTTGFQQYKGAKPISGGGYLECSTYPLFDELENVNLLVVSLNRVIDITSADHQQKLRQQQEQLDAHYKRTSHILESIKDGFLAVDDNWTVKYWNKEAERILQLPREQIIGRCLWDVFPETLNSDVYNAYQKSKVEFTSTYLEAYFGRFNLWLEISAFPTDQGLSVHFKDITLRKENEEIITELNKQYQDLFDMSPFPQFVYATDDFSFRDVNLAAIAHYGYSKAEFLSMTIMDITPAEDIPALKVLIERVKVGAHHKGIFRHLKQTGEVIDVEVAGNSIVYKGENARLVLTVDITEKLRIQTLLQQSEQRYKALVQDGFDMVGILSSEGEYLFVNQTSERILGIPPEYFIGKNAFDFIHEKDQKRFMDTLAMLPHKESMKIPAFLFTDSEGKYRYIDTTVTNMTADPAIGGIIANSRDVTERIVNGMKIQESIDRFDIVFKATSDAIWDYDVATGIVVWNKAVKVLFGYKVDTYTREWWEERVHPDDLPRVNKKVMTMIKGKKSRLMNEYRFRCADNRYKNVLDRSFLMYSDTGEFIRMIGSMQDTTVREKYIQTVEAQNQRLKEIAWTQSHIVRVPLANIIGLVELLADKMDKNGPHKELIAHLSSSSAELDAIIKTIIKKTEMYGKG